MNGQASIIFLKPTIHIYVLLYTFITYVLSSGDIYPDKMLTQKTELHESREKEDIKKLNPPILQKLTAMVENYDRKLLSQTYGKYNISEVENFFNKVRKEFIKYREEVETFKTLINSTISLYNDDTLRQYLVLTCKERKQIFKDYPSHRLKHPIEPFASNNSHILSLLYMIKLNTPLLNSLIKYGKAGFRKFCRSLKYQNKRTITIRNFKAFLTKEDKGPFKREIGYLLNLIVRNDLYVKPQFNRFLRFSEFGVTITHRHACIKNASGYIQPDILEPGFPCISTWRHHYNDSVKYLEVKNMLLWTDSLKEIGKTWSKPIPPQSIFISNPPFLLLDFIDIRKYKPSSGDLVSVEWNQETTIQSFPTSFFMNSIMEGPAKYILTGFVTAQITKDEVVNDSDRNSIHVNYKPFFKIKGKWNDGFPDLFEENMESNEIKPKDSSKERVVTIFYRRFS